MIAQDAFIYCRKSLVAIEFCEEMEQLVRVVPIPGWNHGKSERSLWIYSMFAQLNVPVRLGAIKVQEWKSNIHKMLRSIRVKKSWNEKATMKAYILVNSRLFKYEFLQDVVAPILELALWKAKMDEHSDGNKLQCRFDSLSMVPIIIPHALSFL